MAKNTVDKNSPEYLAKQIASGRHSLLLILIFTLVNLVQLLLDSNSYFLFSASVPYYLTAFCKGMDMGLGVDGIGTFTIIALVVSLVILGIYLLCWLLSKKRMGWLVAAMVLFILDTVCLIAVAALMGFLGDSVLDLVFHVWAVVSMAMAISADGKWKRLAAMEQAQMAYQQYPPYQQPYQQPQQPPYNGPEF